MCNNWTLRFLLIEKRPYIGKGGGCVVSDRGRAICFFTALLAEAYPDD